MSILDTHSKRHQYLADYLQMTIAFQVRLIRLQRGLTQAQLARNSGLSGAKVRKIEDWDAEYPSLNDLALVAKALDVALMVRFSDWKEIIGSIVPTGADESGRAAIEQSHRPNEKDSVSQPQGQDVAGKDKP